MNITILDLINFLKKNFMYAILVMLISSSGYYFINTFKSKTDTLNFEVDLRAWDRLNVSLFQWLENYKHYPNEIKYGIVTSFDASAKCKTDESVSHVLFCYVKGSEEVLDKQYSIFEKRSNLILLKQKEQIKGDIRYFINQKNQAEDFWNDASQRLNEFGDISKLSEYNYRAYNTISEMERKIEVLNRVSQEFEPIVIVKNRSIRSNEKSNINFYTFLSAMLGLLLYLIVGVGYQSSKNNLK